MKLPIKKIQTFCQEEEISYMAVFGSMALGTDQSDSDIDIVVAFNDDRKIGLLHFIGVKQRLEDLLGRKVDLVSKNAINPKLRTYLFNQLTELYPHAA